MLRRFWMWFVLIFPGYGMVPDAGGSGLSIYSYAPIVEAATPAVVNIYTEKVVERTQMLFPGLLGELLGEGTKIRGIEKSLGSGVIVRKDGIVITNFHVVEGASAIWVVLHSGEKLKATLIVGDKRLDLAALKIDSDTSFPFLEIAPYDELHVGDLVWAIGCPRGLRHTVTGGMISGLGRTEVQPGDFRHLIQVDSDLARGSSGGAIVIMTQKGPMLAAIATAILTDNQGAPMGFGIPGIFIGQILRAVDRGGKLERTFDGISPQHLTANMRKTMNISEPGILVKSVYPGSPAERAGIQRGDVILSIGEHALKNPESHQFRLSVAPPGTTAMYRIWRKGKPLSIPVSLEVMPTASKKPLYLEGGDFLSGITLHELNPSLNYEWERDMDEKGVAILEIDRNSRAYMMGFRPQDIIRKINGRTLETLADVEKALRQTVENLEIDRQGQVFRLTTRG